MKLSACTVALSFLFLLLPRCKADDRIVLDKPLSPGDDVIFSDDGSFAFGFFSLSNSTPAKLYLGIWYNGIPERTVVWLANRETPISTTGRGASSAPTLAVTNTSNLVLFDAHGHVVWAAVNVAAGATNSSSVSATATLTNAREPRLPSTEQHHVVAELRPPDGHAPPGNEAPREVRW
jgi:hypothetical protein